MLSCRSMLLSPHEADDVGELREGTCVCVLVSVSPDDCPVS